MRIKSSLTFVAVFVMVFGIVLYPSVTQMDKVFALGFDFGNGKSGLFNGQLSKFLDNSGGSSSNNGPSSDQLGNILDFAKGILSGKGDSSPSSNQPTSGSSSDNPKSSDSSSGGDNSGSGAKCGSSDHYTFHWYCKGTHHHCMKGEQDCLLFGGRTH